MPDWKGAGKQIGLLLLLTCLPQEESPTEEINEAADSQDDQSKKLRTGCIEHSVASASTASSNSLFEDGPA
jgi:hypothetical protein